MSPQFGVAFWFKALITGAVLTLVWMRVDFSTAVTMLSQVKLQWFLAALGIALPLGFTGVQRWRTVAATFGESLPLSKAFMYAWIGQFINLGLPSILGLDSVRAWKLHKHGLPIGLATRVVVVDRLCSLSTLIIILAIGMPRLSLLHGSEIFKHSAVLAFLMGSSGLAVVSATQLGTHLIPTTSTARHLHQLSRDFNHALFGNLASTTKILFWSTCNHLCRIATVLCLSLGLGISISPLDAFVLVPAALLIAMVPISIAGWGVREVVFIQAFSLAGIAPSQALALSLLYGCVGLATSLLGGAVWFAERKMQRLSSSPRHA